MSTPRSNSRLFLSSSLAILPNSHEWLTPIRERWGSFWSSEWKPLGWIVGIFLLMFYLPLGLPRFENAVLEGFHLAKWYAREHVLLCLIPAFFLAGAIAAFVSQGSVMKYLGAGAHKVMAYGVAAVSGTLLAVCSCTVLPLFAGIYRRGAGLGPASAFLYSGPAINALAIILTARVLGWEMGLARAVMAIVFSILIGLAMHFLFRREEAERESRNLVMPEGDEDRPLAHTALFFLSLLGILVFANWAQPAETSGFWFGVWSAKWWLTAGFAAALALILTGWFGVSAWKTGMVAFGVLLTALLTRDPIPSFVVGVIGLTVMTSLNTGEAGNWFEQSWSFAKQILPLLFWGVLLAGFLLGRPGHEGLIPTEWVAESVGGNSLGANLFAAVAGAFMYFATLTEIPILEGLLGAGMGKGPALALLLAGPALSLPNMLVIRSVIGNRKTLAYVLLVVLMSTAGGMIFGTIYS